MKSDTPNLYVSKNLTISKTKQDGEKRKTALRLSGANFGRGGGAPPRKIGKLSRIFRFVGISKTIEYTES